MDGMTDDSIPRRPLLPNEHNNPHRNGAKTSILELFNFKECC